MILVIVFYVAISLHALRKRIDRLDPKVFPNTVNQLFLTKRKQVIVQKFESQDIPLEIIVILEDIGDKIKAGTSRADIKSELNRQIDQLYDETHKISGDSKPPSS